jgi:hypothetical protein
LNAPLEVVNLRVALLNEQPGSFFTSSPYCTVEEEFLVFGELTDLVKEIGTVVIDN